MRSPDRINPTPLLFAATLIALASAGCVTTADGEVIAGSTSAGSTFYFSGVYDSPHIAVHLEVLDHPDGVASWVTVPGSTVFTDSNPQQYPANSNPPYFTWTLSGVPVPVGQTQRWPQGGLLHVRVVANDPQGHGSNYVLAVSDEYGQQCFNDHAGQLWTQIYLACGRPGYHGLTKTSNSPTPADTIANHTIPAYLTMSPLPSNIDTSAYYTKINAPKNLTDFINNNNFNNPNALVATARYYNEGDLGIGRDMHCAKLNGNVACYVSNYAPPNPNNPNNLNTLPPVVFGDQVNSMKFATDPTKTPFATVAMTFSGSVTAPNAVKFMVYDASGNLFSKNVFLDSKGANVNVPSNCVACHGGNASWDSNGLAITGAHFLAFDTFNSLKFDSNAGYPLDNESLRKLNYMVKSAGATPAIVDYIDKSYTGPVGNAGSTQVNTYVPANWTSAGDDAVGLYKTMFAPYCRTCHISQADPANNAAVSTDFTDFAALSGEAAVVGSYVCGKNVHMMPHAEHTLKKFWNSASRAHMTRLLDIYGTCSPN